MCGRFIHNIRSYMTFTSFLLLLPRCQMTETLLLRRTPLINQSIIQSLCPLFSPLARCFQKKYLYKKHLYHLLLILFSDHFMRMFIYKSLHFDSLLPTIADLYHPGAQLFGSSNVLLIMI